MTDPLHDIEEPRSLAGGEGRAPSRQIVVAWRKGSSRAAEARLLAEELRLD